jgi:agmatinase
VGFDLTEVAPAHDGSEWDENVGARILYKLIGWAVVSAAKN